MGGRAASTPSWAARSAEVVPADAHRPQAPGHAPRPATVDNRVASAIAPVLAPREAAQPAERVQKPNDVRSTNRPPRRRDVYRDVSMSGPRNI